MVDMENSDGTSDGLRDGMCSACEMAVVWMESQLKQNATQDRAISYVDEVGRLDSTLVNIVIYSIT